MKTNIKMFHTQCVVEGLLGLLNANATSDHYTHIADELEDTLRFFSQGDAEFTFLKTLIREFRQQAYRKAKLDAGQ